MTFDVIISLTITVLRNVVNITPQMTLVETLDQDPYSQEFYAKNVTIDKKNKGA